MAATTAGTSGSSPPEKSVHAAVLEGVSREELRRVIEHLAQGSDERRVEAVNQKGMTPNGLQSPLVAAHALQRYDLAALLVESGADFGACWYGPGPVPSALAACVIYGQADRVRALLERGHRVDEKLWLFPNRNHYKQESWCSLTHAAIAPSFLPIGPGPTRPSPAVLELLVREGKLGINARDSDGCSPLFYLGAAKSDHEEMLSTLLALGADINPRCPPGGWGDSPCGSSPLFLFLNCCSFSYSNLPHPYTLPCVRMLVEAGADVSGVHAKCGRSVLMHAAQLDRPDFVELLVEKGADVRYVSRDSGRTALHWCCQNRCDETSVAAMCRALIDKGADLNAQDQYGHTPLYKAVLHRHAVVVRLLLERGASPDVFDKEMQTPLMLACWKLCENLSIANLLLEKSAPATISAENSGIRCNALEIAVGGVRANAGSRKEEDALFLSVLRFLSALMRAGLTIRSTHRANKIMRVLAVMADPRDASAALAELRAPSRRWMAHDDLVQLAFDFVELREAEEGVRRREARVRELEEELAARGEGMDDLEEEEEEEDDEEEDEEKKGAGGGKGPSE